jgi:hypothetical protein
MTERAMWAAVGWLGWAVGSYFALLLVWKISKAFRQRTVICWRIFINGLKKSGQREKGSGMWPAIWFAVVMAGIFGWISTRPSPYPIVEEHHIKVLRQVAFNKWAMSSDEEPSFLYIGCDDFPNDRVIWAGYIADHAKWEEQGNCKSIRRADCGWWWSRDENYNARRIN